MEQFKRIVFIGVVLLFGISPYCSEAVKNYAPGVAVICGVLFSVTWGNPFAAFTAKATSHLLAAAIVLMGFGMHLGKVLQAGGSGFLYTFCGILLGLGTGMWLAKRIGVTKDCAWLVSVGTSICGGSAIAAAAPALKSKAHDIAIASATIFTLNAIALLVFPVVGHALKMSESQFGIWSALAIHDTSSVVGATMQYGKEALEIGTTVKLARALWIVPVTMFLTLFVATDSPDGKNSGDAPVKRKLRIRVPWFIPGFLIAAALVTYVPVLSEAGGHLKEFSKALMIVTLFLIGANLSREKLKQLGAKPLIMGVILWVFLSIFWCAAIHFRVIPC